MSERKEYREERKKNQPSKEIFKGINKFKQRENCILYAYRE